MQAITVKFLGPTDNKGTRYRAKCDAGSVTIAQDESVNPDVNAAYAAKALALKLGWRGTWSGGTLPRANSETWVFVMTVSRAFDVAGR